MSLGGPQPGLSAGGSPPAEELSPGPGEEAGLVRRAEAGGAGEPHSLGRAWGNPPDPRPFHQQRFQDTSQYVCAELQALEQEQRQIDGRAAEVETQLRSLMASGGRPESAPQRGPPAALPGLGEPGAGETGFTSPSTAGTLRPCAGKQLAGHALASGTP